MDVNLSQRISKLATAEIPTRAVIGSLAVFFVTLVVGLACFAFNMFETAINFGPAPT
jgi:hypothetical protein